MTLSLKEEDVISITVNYYESFIFAFFITCLKCQDIEILMISKVFFNTNCVKVLSFPNMASTTSSTKKFISNAGL